MATEKKGSSEFGPRAIQLCAHCGEKVKGAARLGQCCSTAEKRLAMDKENGEIFAASGLPFICRMDNYIHTSKQPATV